MTDVVTVTGPDYLRPSTLDEALRLVSDIPGARFVAGATDLMVHLRDGRMEPPPALISLRSLDELAGITMGDTIRIGALTTVRELGEHAGIAAALPALSEAARVFGGPQIRNVATVGGNICNAAPCADTPPPLLVHDARIELRGPAGTRDVPLHEFFSGPGETYRAPDEVVTALLVARPPDGAGSTFLRKGRVAMDLTLVSVAAYLELDGTICRKARLAAGAVAPIPLRLRRTEELLEGKELDEQAIRMAGELAMVEVAPIDDVRTTAAYRRHITGVFVRRGLAALAAGKGVRA